MKALIPQGAESVLALQQTDKWRLNDIEANLDRFEALLHSHGLTIPNKSPFEDLSLAITEMRDVFRGRATHNMREDARERWRYAIGLADLVRKVLSRDGTSSMQTLVPHLELFISQSKNLSLAAGLHHHDDNRNKLFELLIGIAAMRDGTNVDIEHPVKSAGGKNPDILADFFGKRWAFACKAPISMSAKTYADSIRGAVNQIDRCVANHGMVVIHQGSLMNHDAVFPAVQDAMGDWVYYPAANEQMAWEALELEVIRGKSEVLAELGGADGIKALFGKSKAVPVVLNYAAAIAGITKDDQPVVSILRSLTWWHLDKSPPRDVERVLDALNRGIHDR